MVEGGELDPVRVLRNAGIACRQERAARNKKLITAVDWAHCNPPESIDPHQLDVRGGERPIHPAGEGAPGMAGFAVAELASTLGMSCGGATRLIADGLDLRHRLPRLWAGCVATRSTGGGRRSSPSRPGS
ncbi:hypothetical protein FOE78_22190 [Microlunatus elymi]|uniref:Uncharacterized protein n=1 Tax=Microlunatus elymi TaxID=2596828 RepID=A0A516Q481_9ACTN|nr:hypothetical protein [Microlunatus elymi]QDP98253.1 hypothetical protein FOE78_22190 [Microlunatus elymi]